MNEQVAIRDWHTRARVRIVKEKVSRSVEPSTVRTFSPGEELEMIQWGRQGRPVDRSAWWTSYDIDASHILAADNVEVIEVLSEVPPF